MAKNDAEVLEEFTRVRVEGDERVLDVLVITWDGQLAVSEWQEVERLPHDSSDKGIHRRRRHLLQLRRFFKICDMCHERQPVGRIDSLSTCHSCSEQDLGVVH